jgi:REP element-mobilizing transposase RayT
MVDRSIRHLQRHIPGVKVDKYVIMPDHIHLLIHLYDNGRSGTPAPTNANSAIAQFVSTFKRFCNKEYGKNIWQRSYYDHIIRNDQDYREVWQYIEQNPDRADEHH